MRRALVLKKETLAELTPYELGAVNGAAATPRCPTFDDCWIPTDHCVSANYMCLVSQHMDPCLTPPCV